MQHGCRAKPLLQVILSHIKIPVHLEKKKQVSCMTRTLTQYLHLFLIIYLILIPEESYFSQKCQWVYFATANATVFDNVWTNTRCIDKKLINHNFKPRYGWCLCLLLLHHQDHTLNKYVIHSISPKKNSQCVLILLLSSYLDENNLVIVLVWADIFFDLLLWVYLWWFSFITNLSGIATIKGPLSCKVYIHYIDK